ncbi:MAG: AAA family ATPase [Thermoguttaceae bacterium]
MITRIHVNGFKSLEDFDVSLHPGLNILVGPNGSGKTNIVLFFDFLSHLVRGDVSEAVSRVGGAGSVFRRIGDAEFEPTLSAIIYGCRSLGTKRFLYYRYAFELLFPKEIETVTFSSQSLSFSFVKDFVGAADIDNHTEPWDVSVQQTASSDARDKFKVEISRPRVASQLFRFMPAPRAAKGKKKPSPSTWFKRMLQGASSSSETLLLSLPRLMHSVEVMAIVEDMIRGETYNIVPSRARAAEDSAKAPGIERDGGGLSATLYAVKRKKPIYPRYFPYGFYFGRRPMDESVTLRDLLRYLSLANGSISDIDVVNDAFNNQLKVTLKVTSGDYHALLPLAAMSDGTIKWIALTTAVITASSIFSIEEPENYLHPLMQAQILDIMREILLKKRQYSFTVMTTHSETILNNSKPEELIVVSFDDGRTRARRCSNAEQLAEEIKKTGFGLGYYYMAGAVEDG